VLQGAAKAHEAPGPRLWTLSLNGDSCCEAAERLAAKNYCGLQDAGVGIRCREDLYDLTLR
jgi:hypothetical protein